METKLIKGKEIAKWIKGSVKKQAEELLEKYSIEPGLAVVLVGEDPASQVYVRNKIRACKKNGIRSEKFELSAETTTDELLKIINELNERQDIHGILVQLPLPPQIDKIRVLDAISARKDVDGLHPVNMGQLMRGDYHWAACTPSGIMKIFEYLDIDLKGKEAVIMGRSDIVGKPMAFFLLHAHATVTLCHSRTKDLPAKAKAADILISAMGQPGMIGPEYVKPGAIVIDVGTSRISIDQAWPELLVEDTTWKKSFDKKGYAVVGDVRFQQLDGIAEYITPVPGGVGPLTIAMLLHNTVVSAKVTAEELNNS